MKEELKNNEEKQKKKTDGKYANYFEIGHNAYEFILDFGQMYKCEISGFHTRIVTNPVYAKALLISLKESIDKYEHDFEEIENKYK